MLGDLMRKSLATGMGLLWVTKEKAEEIVGEWVQQGQLNAEQSRETVDRLVKQAEKQRNELSRVVGSQVEKAMSVAGLAKRSELEALREEVNRLAERVHQLEQGAPNGSDN